MFCQSVLECQEGEGGLWIERNTNSLWKMFPADLTSHGRLQGWTLLQNAFSLVTAFSREVVLEIMVFQVRTGEFMILTLCYFGRDGDGEKERGMIKISCVETVQVRFITHLCEVQARLARSEEFGEVERKKKSASLCKSLYEKRKV